MDCWQARLAEIEWRRSLVMLILDGGGEWSVAMSKIDDEIGNDCLRRC